MGSHSVKRKQEEKWSVCTWQQLEENPKVPMFIHIVYSSAENIVCLLTFLRQRKLEREKNQREKHYLVASHVLPNRGMNPKTFWCTRRCSNQLSQLARARGADI